MWSSLTAQCARIRAYDFFCIIDTLTSASVLPGVDVIIEEFRKSVVSASHDRVDNMSSYAALRVRRSSSTWEGCSASIDPLQAHDYPGPARK